MANPRLILFSVFLVLMFALTAAGQSGRRSLPVEGPKATSAPTPSQSKTKPQPAKDNRVKLVATEYIASANMSFETGVAFRSFLGRLEESGFVVVTSKADVRRKEAIDLARSKSDVYVAWLQLEIDLMGSADAKNDAEKAAITPINPACLFVSYALFEPGTGSVLAQGHTYQPGYQDRCAGTVYHPSPYPDRQSPSRTTPELALKRAGSEAADRILTNLDIAVPEKRE